MISRLPRSALVGLAAVLLLAGCSKSKEQKKKNVELDKATLDDKTNEAKEPEAPGWDSELPPEMKEALKGIDLKKELLASVDAAELARSQPPGPGNRLNASTAAFQAWQQFIALNRPAQCTGPADTSCLRDAANASAALGSNFSTTNPNSSTPTAWMTFRHKTEVYTSVDPTKTSDDPPLPAGYKDAASNSQNTPGQGYNLLPAAYKYWGASSVPPCTKANIQDGISLSNDQPAVASPALVNLDETSQIGLNEMFAGVVEPVAAGDADPRKEKNLIRFLAKTNFHAWSYVTTTPSGTTGRTLNLTSSLESNSLQTSESQKIQGLQAAAAAAKNGTDGQPYTSAAVEKSITLPVGTMELKSGWRRLTDAEKHSGRFVVQNVRYYHPTKTGGSCYVESKDQGEVWGMVALHIIQRTSSFPQGFTFATFGHIDNISYADGTPVERPNGQINTSPGNGNQVPQHPTQPQIASNPDLAGAPTKGVTSYTQQTFEVADTACDPIGKQLYYVNLKAGESPHPSPHGAICYQKRWHQIPDGIAALNSTIQGAPPVTGTPLSNYRLVGVQSQPLSFPQVDQSLDHNPLTYYLANEVVETNYNLQSFRGGQINGGSQQKIQGLINDYFNPASGTTGPYYNLFIYQPESKKWNEYNMGGCMGCHGVAQLFGGDFSFLLTGPGAQAPEAFEPELYDIGVTSRARYTQ